MRTITGEATVNLPFPPINYYPVYEQVEVRQNWKRFIRLCKSLHSSGVLYTVLFRDVYLEGNGGMYAEIVWSKRCAV